MQTDIHLKDLALVHLTQAKPIMEDGVWHIETSFRRGGGFSQNPMSDRIQARQTLHYSLQSAVTDHVYGQFEGRQWAVISPLTQALEANGVPETMLASDMAFFPQAGRMKLPESQVVEFTNDLPSHIFIQQTEGGLKVAKNVTPENTEQAKQWFSNLEASGHPAPSILQKLNDPASTWSETEITEAGITSALAALNKPSLENLRNITPGSPMGFDGWLSRKELEPLVQEIEKSYSSHGMGAISIGRHNGAWGDQLFDVINSQNNEKLDELIDNKDVPPRIKAAMNDWKESSLYQKVREKEIWKELEHGSIKILEDSGRERPGIVGSMFGPRASGFFDHPRMGPIEFDEVDSILSKSSPEQRTELAKSLTERAKDPDNMPSSLLKMAGYVESSKKAMTPPPPPPAPFSPPPLWRKKEEMAFSRPPPPPTNFSPT